MMPKLIFKTGVPDLSKKKLAKIVRRHNSPLFDSLLRGGALTRNPNLSFDNRMFDHLTLDKDI